MIDEYVNLARLHAPLLLITAPLIAAALALALGNARLGWLIGVIVTLAMAALALDLAGRELLSVTPAEASEGLGLSLDRVGAFSAALIAVAAAIVMISAAAFWDDFGRGGAAYAIPLLLCIGAGWTAVAFARDVVGLLAGVETAWLASTGLVALGSARHRGALNGAARMLFSGGVGAALLLLGASMVAAAIGSPNIADLAEEWTGPAALCSAGVALVLVALSLKAGAAPLHAWTAPTFERGSALAALAIGVIGAPGALAALARVTAFAIGAPSIAGGVTLALSTLGVAAAVLGSAQAVGAANLRRLAAYALSAQAGCTMLGVALGSPAGFEAALVQLFALASSVLALVAGAAAAGGDTFGALDGLGRRAPLASLAITAGALSLMGAPLTTGFLGRWRLIEAALGAGWWWAAAAAIGCSLAGVFYGGRLIERMYFRRSETSVERRTDVWRFALAPALLSAIASVAFGLQPILLLRAASSASLLLLGHAP